jgi:hypothetical protein
LNSLKIVYTFRKFNVDICGKKPLEKISIPNIKKGVEGFQIFK